MTRNRLLRWLSPLVTLPMALFGGLVLAYAGGFGGRTSIVRLVAAGVFAIFVIALPFRARAARAMAMCAVLTAIVSILWLAQPAKMERDWWEPASRLPWAEIDGDLVTIHDVRNFRYRTDADWDAAWYDATYDVSRIQQGYFVLTRFGSIAGAAHVMASFRFDGDQFVVLSYEIRREDGESYDPIGGMFREYELMLVAADERDALALRTNIWNDDTWVIPVDAGPEATGAFFLDMIRRMNELHAEPEWYSTLQSSCATNLAAHYERVNDVGLPPDHRVVLAGFSDQVVDELGLLPPGVSLEQAQELFLVNEAANAGPVDETYSRRIRAPFEQAE